MEDVWKTVGSDHKLRFNPKEIIGKGGFSVVYGGLFVENGETERVAAKCIQKGYMDLPLIEQEAVLMLKAQNHLNILRYICYIKDDLNLWIVTELCKETLQEWIERKYREPDQVAVLTERKILYQVTDGLAYLHRIGIVHRDIKPTNILISMAGVEAKLADFGISRALTANEGDFTNSRWSNPNGTKGWIAPELYHNGRYDFKVDIFPLGCIFGYTLSKEKQHPFGDDPDERSVQIKKKLSPTCLTLEDMKEPYSNDRVALKLIQSMIRIKPEYRPTAENILSDSFFKEYGLAPRLARLSEKQENIDEGVIVETPMLSFVEPDVIADILRGKPSIPNNTNGITADDVTDQSENEELLVENEDNQLIDNNVLNIHWSLNMMTPKQILGIVMVVIVSLFCAQSQIRMKNILELLEKEIFASYVMELPVTGVSLYDNARASKVRTNELLKLSSYTSRLSEKEVTRFRELVEDDLVEVNATDRNDGMNALLKLSRNYEHDNLIELVQPLITRGIDVNATDPYGWNALHYLCRYYKHNNLIDLIRLLHKSNIEFEVKTEEGSIQFYLAAFEKNPAMQLNTDEIIELLPKQGHFLNIIKTVCFMTL